MANGARADGRRLREDTEAAEHSRYAHELVRIFEHELACEAVEPGDAAFAVVTGETRVGRALLACDAVVARPAHGCRHELAALEPAPGTLDHAEHLVPHDKQLAIVRRNAEQALGDLAVRAAHADLQHAHEHAVAPRLGDVVDPRRMRDARLDDERLHAAVKPPSTVRIVPVANSAVAR